MTAPPVLVALTPGDLPESDRGLLVTSVRACAAAGLSGLVLREPGWCDRVVLSAARELREILRHGWLCIHDRVHLAVEARADAVHLGWRSLAPLEARAILPAHVAIGFSSHVGDDPRVYGVCDYLFFGPVRETPSKEGLITPTGFDGLARAASATRTPIWALGGLRPEDVASARAAGAAGAAVRGGILRAADPAAACARYLAAWRSDPPR